MLPLVTVGLLTGCGKHTSASSSVKSPTSHSSTSVTPPASKPAGSKSSKASGSKTAHTGACHPTSKKGNCYEAGEMCAKTQYGQSGVAGNGKSIACKEVKGVWRWVAA